MECLRKSSWRSNWNFKGKDVFNKQSFKNVSVDATDDKLVELSDAVEKLMDYTVSTIKKQQTFMLTRK